MSSTKYLTSKEFVEFIRKTSGAPLTLSRFRKDRMQKNGIAPKPVAHFGNRDLFTEDQAPNYIAKLITPAEQQNEAA